MARTITSAHSGPAHFSLRIPAGQATVTAGHGTRQATVTLRPANPSDEVASKAVEEAEIHDNGGRLEVTVPARGTEGGRGNRTVITGGGNVTVVSSGRGVSYVSGNNIVVSGNGVVIGGGGGSVVINGGTGGVLADVSLPAHSSVRINADAADVVTHGPLEAVTVESDSGDVAVGQATTVEITTGSGDVTVAGAGTISAKTGSGDVLVETGDRVTVRCGSGDVTIQELRGRGQIRTGSGGRKGAHPDRRSDRDHRFGRHQGARRRRCHRQPEGSPDRQRRRQTALINAKAEVGRQIDAGRPLRRNSPVASPAT
jgi:hypothetical protein